MWVIPAVDIQSGRAVRLFEGDPNRETVYYDNPVEAALHWQEQGAPLLHLVDLDAATGRGQNRAVLRAIAESIAIPFEVGGGVRSVEAARELLALGASRVVVGTVAVKAPDVLEQMLGAFGPERVVVSLDARGLEVVVSGWAEETALGVQSLALRMWAMGVRTLIYTDVRRDGTLAGLDLEVVREVRAAWPGFLIAGGGIASDADLLGLQSLGVEGAITGKALYEGRIDLKKWA
ncbi:MAG: 1-(5-phosphoribosyl)-5-[(5-phosphoribosylamino)methylideneamino]imidazole-4-carboxamide isomerase [Meiothermus sp.]|uniref:1-(5-phosphoribosyl)-5-[(5- phosphoribosylamino)methylideneamino]imidazole-4- carboxamide isomerase n=1 Tax=Meiothermus sp. TaxID=1955249 RepID=UPI0025F9804F|nr:1-(5-phosphoribosyl)-5-[(5-phosphoribosylamino)methylideneamino]imidazole-4-carboxamide isomerase [Meiothermus sp.]MCS7068532.1 1-(5-phosphoribosyl)-5-[(5-phosphoribosylamino)methylideneamino]imidazole-4-carboxamide isomerase [Meiothermus sp.]MCX7601274.1 1-(5-phosphoribosyl)-5-[(5-phosphoribosylamino)methylideneamino]imidazole-4-carboxamide isomerase [Meiothermus sp.]MDW8424773.1 1-(5-phosphoribosyl)-5-[(5-phosphoribosylamino)methylideneamino]imidazole-4-carboxamide isomerase [Meiothermus sp